MTRSWSSSRARQRRSPSRGELLGGADDVGEHDRGQHPLGRRRRTAAGEELLDVREAGGVAPHVGVLAVVFDEARPGDEARHLAAALDRDHAVPGAVQDQGGDADRGQDRPQVGLRGHVHQLAGHPGADRRALEPPPPLHELGVVRLAGREHRHQRAVAPVVLDGVEHRLVAAPHQRVGAVGGHPAEDERRDLLGVGGGKQRRQAEIGAADHRHAIGAGGREHGLEIVHLLLEGGRRGDRIRQAGAPAVEHDQPGELGHRPERARGPRLLPDELQMRRGAVDHHQVARTIAHRLVGDAGVAAARVVGGWRAHDPHGKCNRAAMAVYKHVFDRKRSYHLSTTESGVRDSHG